MLIRLGKLARSHVKLSQMLAIILLIKWQLLPNQQTFVSAAKSKALIYNKDGKFIYRPAKSNQGHIIVIDDRHHHHNQDEHQRAVRNQPPGAESAFHPIQLIGPRVHYQPAGGFYPQAVAAGSGANPAVQLISLADMQAIGQPLSAAGSAAVFRGAQPTTGSGVFHAGSQAAQPQLQMVPLIQLYGHPAAAALGRAPAQAQPEVAPDQQRLAGGFSAYYQPMGDYSQPDAMAQYALAAQQQLAGSHYQRQVVAGRQQLARNFDSENPLSSFDISSLQASPAFQDEQMYEALQASRQQRAPAGGQRHFLVDNYEVPEVREELANDLYDEPQRPDQQQQQQAQQFSRNSAHRSAGLKAPAYPEAPIPGYIAPPPPPPSSQQLPPPTHRHIPGPPPAAAEEPEQQAATYRSGPPPAEIRMKPGGELPVRKFYKRTPQLASLVQQQTGNGKQRAAREFAGAPDQLLLRMSELDSRDAKSLNYWRQFKDQYDILS